MKNRIGFSINEGIPTEVAPVVESKNQAPGRSLVTVRFLGGGPALTYYNDRFDLQPGDTVFVEGKYAGEIGVVEKVTRKFKINLADFKRVISVADKQFHGTYESIMDKMVSFDADAFSPDQFRTWVMAPQLDENPNAEGKKEVIFGEGYDLDMRDIEKSDDVSFAVLQRAAEYCNDGSVAYIAVRDGIGTAFIEGTYWYEVNFRLDGNMMSEMYCDCPFPGLCKHLVAVALTLRGLDKQDAFSLERDFVAFDANRFWMMIARTQKKISL